MCDMFQAGTTVMNAIYIRLIRGMEGKLQTL